MGQNLDVVVDDHDGISVCRQVVHHPCKAFQVIGMQANRGFVQDIEHTGRPVTDSPGQLYPLTLSGGQSRGRPVQG